MIETIGFTAAACTTLAFVPQVVRVWRTRAAEDISLGMYVILLAGLIQWIIYGAWIHSTPLVMANAVTMLLAAAVLAGKLTFMRSRGR